MATGVRDEAVGLIPFAYESKTINNTAAGRTFGAEMLKNLKESGGTIRVGT